MSANNITYNDLKNLILGALNRDDPRVIEQLNTFIMLPQRYVCRKLNITGFLKFEDGNFIVGQATVPKPLDWLTTFSMRVYYNKPYQTLFNNSKRLKNRVWTYCEQYNEDNTARGVPSQYSDMEYGNWRVALIPDKAYPYIVGYYQIPNLLSEENQQNFLTQYNPDCIYYGAVSEANYFLQNYGEGDKWKQLFLDSIENMKWQDNRLVGDIGDTRQLSDKGAS